MKMLVNNQGKALVVNGNALVVDDSNIIYQLYNYTCDGTEATAINTGIQLCNGDYSTFLVEFDFTINAMTPQNACFFRCRHETKYSNSWPGFGLRAPNDTNVDLQINNQTKKVSADIGTRCIGTVTLSDGVVVVDCNGNSVSSNLVTHSSPFVIGGELSNSANGTWNGSRFSNITIHSLIITSK